MNKYAFCLVAALVLPFSAQAKYPQRQKGIVDVWYFGFSPDGRYFAFCVHEDSLGGGKEYQAVTCSVLDESRRGIRTSSLAPCQKEQQESSDKGLAVLGNGRDYGASTLRFELGEGDLDVPPKKLSQVLTRRMRKFMEAQGNVFQAMGIGGHERVLYSAALAKYRSNDTEVELSGKSQVKVQLGKMPLWLRLREKFVLDCKEVPAEKAFLASWDSHVQSQWLLQAKIGKGQYDTVYQTEDEAIAHRIVRVSVPDRTNPKAAVVIVESISLGYENARIPTYQAVMVPLGRGQESED